MPTALRLVARRIKAAGYFLLGELALLVFKGLRLTDPAWAAHQSAKLLRFIGPWLPEHRTGRANLQAAFPDWPAEQVEQTLGSVWENLGRDHGRDGGH
jgi:KDO2-lipid IV(A) lauroyltransferase